MTDFVLEIFSEEIPAKMQKNAAENFAKIAAEILAKNHLKFISEQIKVFIAPCRLSLVIYDLLPVQKTVKDKKIGPKISADAKAIQGFLKANGLQDVSQLQISGDFYVCDKSESEIKTEKIIEISLPQILQKMQNSWPKLMVWNVDNQASQVKWIRPVRNILALFGDALIPCDFFGLSSNQQSFNKRGEAFTINNSKDYEHLLEKNSIIVDAAKRRKIIIEQIHQLSIDNQIRPYIDLNETSALLSEVVGLCEKPHILLGKIDDKFLSLPVEALVLSLQSNQKFFCCFDLDGNFSSKFLFACDVATMNSSADNIKRVIADNEKIVRARLADLEFFVEEDLKTSLMAYSSRLNSIVFHQKLGSVADKVERIKEMAKFLSIFVPHCDIKIIDKAGNLCKADLLTRAVAEMPELQGKIGSFYAKIQGETPEITEAIYEHYLPIGPDSDLPKNPLSVALSIADKIDSIVGFFLIGEKPTSSKDPFALRRFALAVIRTALTYDIAFPIRILIERSVKSYVPKIQKILLDKNGDFVSLKNRIVDEILCFIVDRLKIYLREREGLTVEVVNLVVDEYLANIASHKYVDILFLVKKTRFVDNLIKSPNNALILSLYRRCANILAIQEKKEGKIIAGKPSSFRFKTKEEKNLYQIFKKINGDFLKKMKVGNFEEAYKMLAIIEEPLNKFFENVMVADEDETLRENRLLLLSCIRTLFNSVANLSKIEFLTK